MDFTLVCMREQHKVEHITGSLHFFCGPIKLTLYETTFYCSVKLQLFTCAEGCFPHCSTQNNSSSVKLDRELLWKSILKFCNRFSLETWPGLYPGLSNTWIYFRLKQSIAFYVFWLMLSSCCNLKLCPCLESFVTFKNLSFTQGVPATSILMAEKDYSGWCARLVPFFLS